MGPKLLCFSFVACILISQVNSIFFNKGEEEPEKTIHIHYIHHLPGGVAPPVAPPAWPAPRENDDKGGLLNILKKLIFSEDDKGGQQHPWFTPQAPAGPVYGPPPVTYPQPAPVYGPPSFSQQSFPQQSYKPSFPGGQTQQLPAYNPPQAFNPKPVYGPPTSQFVPSQQFSSTGADSYFPEKSPIGGGSGGYQRRAFRVDDNEEFMNSINTAIQDGLRNSGEK